MQQRLTKWQINGQTVIEGPAGSGKSIVLLKRALYIKKQNPDWKIGIICYNTIMANYLKLLFQFEEMNEDDFDVYDVLIGATIISQYKKVFRSI